MQILMRALSSPPFGNYHVWWSLADSKYAGTALLVKKCCKPKRVCFSVDRTGSFSLLSLQWSQYERSLSGNFELSAPRHWIENCLLPYFWFLYISWICCHFLFHLNTWILPVKSYFISLCMYDFYMFVLVIYCQKIFVILF